MHSEYLLSGNHISKTTLFCQAKSEKSAKKAFLKGNWTKPSG
jgi:hypothetical protein